MAGGLNLYGYADGDLPYADRRLHEIKMAMRIGREYLARRVARSDWMTLASAARVPQKYVLERLEALLPRIPEAAERVVERAIAEGLAGEVVEPLTARIVERSQECTERLRQGAAAD